MPLRASTRSAASARNTPPAAALPCKAAIVKCVSVCQDVAGEIVDAR